MIDIIDIQKKYFDSFYQALDSVSREKKYLAALEAPEKNKVKEFVMDHIKNKDPQVVALDQDKVVGWCDLSFNWRPVFRHCGYLGMGVLKNYRGRGIGKVLLEGVIQRAKVKKLERIEFEVFSSNKIAIKLYQKMGFKKEGKKIRAAKTNNRYEDLIIMVLFL